MRNFDTICRIVPFVVLALMIFLVYTTYVNESQSQVSKQTFVDISPVPVRDFEIETTSTTTTSTNQAKLGPKLRQKDAEMFQSQTNTELVKEIQTSWLKPPSNLPYNYSLNNSFYTNVLHLKKLHKIVLKLLGEKKNGFFIECGAFNGVELSNTLHLERDYNWTGLLVEADPRSYQQLLQSQRKAWSINACLSIEPRKSKVNMSGLASAPALSVIKKFANDSFHSNRDIIEFEVQCFPLTSILAALGESCFNVDYLSLDIEGAELAVLQTIPWEYVHIKVISLEANESRGTLEPVVHFLRSKNYNHTADVVGDWINDHVFVLRNAEML